MAKLNSKQLQKAHSELKDEARQRVADRGVLQFRADPETIRAVMEAADKHNMPVGALIRQWIQEKLEIDDASRKTPDLLTRMATLEDAVTKLQQTVKKRSVS